MGSWIHLGMTRRAVLGNLGISFLGNLNGLRPSWTMCKLEPSWTTLERFGGILEVFLEPSYAHVRQKFADIHANSSVLQCEVDSITKRLHTSYMESSHWYHALRISHMKSAFTVFHGGRACGAALGLWGLGERSIQNHFEKQCFAT